MANMTKFLFLITAAALSARAANETGARLDRAAAVFAKLTTAPHGIRPEQIDSADCIAVVPGFKKGAAVVGVGFGRGFISRRTDAGWSAPGAIAFETGSLGVQLGAEEIDVVIVSMDRSRAEEKHMVRNLSVAHVGHSYKPSRISLWSRTVFGLLGLFALLPPVNARAEGLSIGPPASTQSAAFARYIASIHERNPFTESGPVAVEIQASLPGLYKESRVLAIRQTGESERSEYRVLQIEGDPTVVQEVIARYFEVQEQLEDLPVSSVAITPANYKFRYIGEVGTGATSAYVFRITPKKKRAGLIQGQLWIDSLTGAAVLLAGHFIKTSSAFIGRVEVVRDTKLLDGHPCVRITHVAVETRQVGHGELTIAEFPLLAADDEAPSQQEARREDPEEPLKH